MTHRRLNSAVGRLRSLLTDLRDDPLTDQQLLQRFLATREEAAFAALLERHGPMVLAVCRSVLRHAQDAEDAFQATFLVLARKAAAIRKPASLAPWLHGVAYRLATRARTARGPVRDTPYTDRAAADVMDELTGRELRRILHEEITRLPDSYRLPLILCYLEGRTQDEAARALGWSATTLKGRVDRARDLLRRRLSRRGLSLGLPLLLASLPGRTARGALPGTMAERAARTALRSLVGESFEGNAGRAVALAEGWERAMWTFKLKVGAALTLALAILGAGAGLAAYAGLPSDPPEARDSTTRPGPGRDEQAEAKEERLDRRGDPLPDAAVLRFGSARLRHGSVIRGSALAPDGKTLATAGDHAVVVWNLDTGKPLHRFPCQHGSTYCSPGLAFSPDGKRLGYVRGYGFACVWDLQTGKELRQFERRFDDRGGRFWAGFCGFANGGRELVVFSRVGIETWDIDSGTQTASVPTRASLLSPDGKRYVHADSAAGLSLGDAVTGDELNRFRVNAKHDGIENGLAFSPDGKLLALVNASMEIQVRDTTNATILATCTVPSSTDRIHRGGGSGREYRLAFSTDSKTVFLGGAGGVIHRWNVADGKELPPLSKHHSALAGMHTLPDGRTLISTGQDGVTHRWDLKTGRPAVGPDQYEGRSAAAYSADGQFVAVGDARGRIDLWDGRDGKPIRTLQRDGAEVAHLAFSPDGTALAAAQRSGTVQFWDVPSGRAGEVWKRESAWREWYCSDMLFSPDGRFLCTSESPKRMRVVEVASGKLLWTADGSPSGVAFAPDGRTLLVGRGGPNLAHLDARTGEQRSTVRLNLSFSDGVGGRYALAFSPDGRRVAVGDFCGGLTLGEAPSLARTQTLMAGRSLIDIARAEEGTAQAPDRIRALAFSADGKWLAAGGEHGGISVWETATGKEVFSLRGHDAEVSCVAFSPDGRSVFSHGQDGQGYLWDLRPKQAGRRVAPSDLWADLAGTDAGKAYRAVWALGEDPRGLSYLREKLAPAAPPEKARVKKLIADLDSDLFEVRQAASGALAELAELVAADLEEACKAPSSAEQRRRLESLLTALKEGLSPAQLRQSRAVQAARLADTTQARELLKEWAGGVGGALLTQEARAALDRRFGR